MEIERIAVALRPRSEWEALDLGFQMAREWWQPIWGVWFALYLPVAALLLMTVSNKAIAVLVLWWLKPLFDRAVLYAASRAVFGESCGVMATLRAARDWLRPGLIGALTFRRFDLARSFTLPVPALEKQTGTAATKRRSALGARTRGYAVWLTVVCVHIEWIAMVATFAIVGMLEPSAADFAPGSANGNNYLGPFQGLLSWTVRDALHYVAAVSLMEPFYVTAGFALYLNRRTILEGWDIEVQLRRLEARMRGAAKAAAMLLAATLLAGAAAFCIPDPAYAAQSERLPQREIREVLASPDFGSERQVERWRYVGERKDRPGSEPLRFRDSWRNLILLLSDISQGLLWAVAIALIAIALYTLRRFMPEPRLRAPGYKPPDILFGLELAPESLPADVAAAAAAAARAGRTREALSLLYRGALSALVHKYQTGLRAGDTEGDCVRAAGGTMPAEGAHYFRQLVSSWQAVAYAGRLPAPASVEALCRNWTLHFAQPVHA